jgi:predicted metal-dependent phosphoesterase TrpH
MLRADLHVHTYHSGLNGNLPFLKSRDCYSSPEAVYRTAKARGMDLVAVTDHDSIDGCLELLDRNPDLADLIVGEEITCWWPGVPLEVHIAAYGMDETLHRDVQRLSENVHDVVACLRERRVPAVFNHPFHFFRHQVPLEEYLTLLADVDGVEVRNGAMLAVHNDLVERLVSAPAASGPWTGGRPGRLSAVGGSDAHTLRRVGRTWTAAPAATRDGFLQCLLDGRTTAGGDHGSSLGLATDIYAVIGRYWLALAGLERNDLSWRRRALGVAFSAVSLPFEMMPLAIAANGKRRERAIVRDVQARLLPAPAAMAVTEPAEGLGP